MSSKLIKIVYPYKIASKMIKIIYPDGQQMIVNLSLVSRVYTDNTNVVLVTTEATNPSRFYSENKTVCKKIHLELPTVADANTTFDNVIGYMDWSE